METLEELEALKTLSARKHESTEIMSLHCGHVYFIMNNVRLNQQKTRKKVKSMNNDIVSNHDFVFEFTSEKDLDNVSAMSLFIEQYDLEDFVVEDYGTTVSFNFDGEIVHLSSCGGGDFFNHIIERVNG